MMKKGATTAIVLVVLVIGIIGAVLLYSGTSGTTGAVPVGKVTLCHRPGFQQQTISVDPASLGAVSPPSGHYGHGDTDGPCPSASPGPSPSPPSNVCGDGEVIFPEDCEPVNNEEGGNNLDCDLGQTCDASCICQNTFPSPSPTTTPEPTVAPTVAPTPSVPPTTTPEPTVAPTVGPSPTPV